MHTHTYVRTWNDWAVILNQLFAHTYVRAYACKFINFSFVDRFSSKIIAHFINAFLQMTLNDIFHFVIKYSIYWFTSKKFFFTKEETQVA